MPNSNSTAHAYAIFHHTSFPTSSRRGTEDEVAAANSGTLRRTGSLGAVHARLAAITSAVGTTQAKAGNKLRSIRLAAIRDPITSLATCSGVSASRGCGAVGIRRGTAGAISEAAAVLALLERGGGT